MTSKNLFFKLAKEDGKRRVWLAALSFLVFFFTYPIVLALQLSNVKKEYAMAFQYGPQIGKPEHQALMEAAEQVLSPYENPIVVMVIIGAAVVCGVSSFAYLHNKRKVDFYHSIPVKRGLLFTAAFSVGILIPAAAYALCLGIALIIAASYGVPVAGLAKMAVTGWFLHMLYFLLIYSTVSLAMIMTGNLIVGLLGGGVFFLFFPWLTFIIQGYFQTWFTTYLDFSETLMDKLMRLSPIVSYILAVRKPESWQYEGSLTFEGLIAASGLAVAILVVLCVLLYKKRPSEAAGKAMAFPVSKPVIRILLTLLSSLSGGLFFWLLQSSTGWAVFGIAVGAILCHCMIEIIYHFDFRRLFDHKIQLAVCMMGSLAVLFCFKNDWTGYDAYLPEKGTVAEAAIEFGRDGWVTYFEIKDGEEGQAPELVQIRSLDYVFDHMKMTNVEPVLEIAKKGIEYTLMEKTSKEQYYEMEEQKENWGYVTIQYTLTNGKKVWRQYRFPLSEAWEAASTIYLDEAYQQGKYPVLGFLPEDIVKLQYQVTSNGRQLEEDEITDPVLAGRILEAYQQDLKELSLDTRKQEAPIGELRFLNQKEENFRQYVELEKDRNIRWYSTSTGYYPIYPSFTRTLNLLAEAGIEPEKLWEHLDVIGVTVEKNLNPGDVGYKEAEDDIWQGCSVTYDKKEQNQQILELVVLENYYDMNDFWQREDSITIYVTVNLGKQDNYGLIGFLPEGMVPDMVERDLAEEARRMEEES
ncbi:MAG: DUF6449 domain-containing protein [Lachnospiraceae bacterium]|jgi:ABC-2 type transport system permease protein